MRTQHEQPSDRLQGGAVSGFDEALELVDAQFEGERAIMRRAGAPAEELARMDASHARISTATGHARRIWLLEQAEAERRTIDRLRADALAAEAALDDEAAGWLGLLATALEQGDYAGLAI